MLAVSAHQRPVRRLLSRELESRRCASTRRTRPRGRTESNRAQAPGAASDCVMRHRPPPLARRRHTHRAPLPLLSAPTHGPVAHPLHIATYPPPAHTHGDVRAGRQQRREALARAAGARRGVCSEKIDMNDVSSTTVVQTVSKRAGFVQSIIAQPRPAGRRHARAREGIVGRRAEGRAGGGRAPSQRCAACSMGSARAAAPRYRAGSLENRSLKSQS